MSVSKLTKIRDGLKYFAFFFIFGQAPRICTPIYRWRYLMKKYYFLLLAALIIMGSCSTGDAGVSAMLGGSSQALLYLGSRAVSEDEIEFNFSQPVTIKQLSIEPHISINSIEEGSTVRVKLENEAKPGILLTADLLAEDGNKNTINVLVSFRSRNNRMPELVINELCTEYSTPRT